MPYAQAAPPATHRPPTEHPDDFEPSLLPIDPDDAAPPPLVPEEPADDGVVEPPR